MANTENLQDLILNEVRREHTAVTMFLMMCGNVKVISRPPRATWFTTVSSSSSLNGSVSALISVR